MAEIVIYRSFRGISFLLLLIIALSGCAKIQAPEFKTISDLNVNVVDTVINISGNGVFYNPNKSRIVLKSADIEVFINDQSFTKINRKFNLDLAPEHDFTVPLDFKLNNAQVQEFLKKNAVQMLLGNSIHVKYKGNIRVKALNLGMKVPLDREISLSLKNFL